MNVIRISFLIINLMVAINSFVIAAEPESQQAIITKLQQLPRLQAQILSPNQVFTLPQSVWNISPTKEVKLVKGKNWLQLDVLNLANISQSYFLFINDAIHFIGGKLYIVQADGSIKQVRLEKHLDNGLTGQFSLEGGQQLKLYVMLNSAGQVTLPLSVLAAIPFADNQSGRSFFSGIAIGSIAMLSLILLVIFIVNRNRKILLLSSYFLIQAMLLAVFYGMTNYGSFTLLGALSKIELPLLMSLSAIIVLWFSAELFALKFTHRSLNLVFKSVIIGLLLYLPSCLFWSLDVNLIIANLINLLVSLLLILLGGILVSSGQRLARLFSLVFIIQFIVYVTNIILYGWQQFNASLFTFAFWLNSVLIGFLLSRQYTEQLEAKRIAQQEALQNEMISREAQEELLVLQNENQEQLEIRVQERTMELNIALQELADVNRELEQKNTLDSLTGLYNRRFYDQKIKAEFRRSRRNLTPLSLVIIDIDHFKSVNDTYGHLVGDNCLISLAVKIKQCLSRSTDVGCRYGGEEFCLILPETTEAGALAFAEELRQKVENSISITDEKQLSLTVSCGVSTYLHEEMATPEDLFSAADKALYSAKNLGRNQVASRRITVPTVEL
jgi:diguanylate cyclase (GGDEF)-like protein